MLERKEYVCCHLFQIIISSDILSSSVKLQSVLQQCKFACKEKSGRGEHCGPSDVLQVPSALASVGLVVRDDGINGETFGELYVSHLCVQCHVDKKKATNKKLGVHAMPPSLHSQAVMRNLLQFKSTFTSHWFVITCKPDVMI